MRVCKLAILFLCLGLWAAAGCGAGSAQPGAAPRAWALAEAGTGRVLDSSNADERVGAASLAKLMTCYLTLEAVDKGMISLTDRGPVAATAWASKQPAGSSLMFLGPGQSVSTRELLRGLLTVSGNDAAVALAIRVSGNQAAFVRRMNSKARLLGLSRTHFVDSAGVSPMNVTTARDMVGLAVALLTRWPRVPSEYSAASTFIYPLAANLPPGAKPQGVVQYNRNSLIGAYAGCDGLKTGHTEEAGYHLVATAARKGIRLVAVVLGVQAQSEADGSARRAAFATNLLDEGFHHSGSLRLQQSPERGAPDAPDPPSTPGAIPQLQPR